MKKSPERIPVAEPWITDREIEMCTLAARCGWGIDHYRFNEQFEKMFAEFVGVRYAVSLPHATSALHLICAAIALRPGDEVIAPNVTWIASVAPIVYTGATPILVDIDPDTWCIDPAAVETAITSRTKAILGVNLYGSMCNWTKLRKIAERFGLFLIEDAAESLGSTFCSRQAGSHGDAAAFSFHGSKTVTTGEGGMLVTDNQDLFDRVLFLRDHGRKPNDRAFQNTEIAFKYKMSAVQAGIGVAQMERIDELIDYKRNIFNWYHERLQNHSGLALNAEPLDVFNSYWMVTVVFDQKFGKDKYDFQEQFLLRNIDTRPFFSPLSKLQAFANRTESISLVCGHETKCIAAFNGINLPSGYNMTKNKVDLVCDVLEEITELG